MVEVDDDGFVAEHRPVPDLDAGVGGERAALAEDRASPIRTVPARTSRRLPAPIAQPSPNSIRRRADLEHHAPAERRIACAARRPAGARAGHSAAAPTAA